MDRRDGQFNAPKEAKVGATDCFEPTTFFRHKRRLRALMLESQAWFCLRDLGRLMGVGLDERMALKLDADQRLTVWLGVDEQWEKCMLVSESGAYAMMVHHYVPENRALRQWLTHDVLPVLRLVPQDQLSHVPEQTLMDWQGVTLSFLYWQNEPWVRLRDMPELMQRPRTRPEMPTLDGRSRELWGR